jgi:hypothetical protein
VSGGAFKILQKKRLAEVEQKLNRPCFCLMQGKGHVRQKRHFYCLDFWFFSSKEKNKATVASGLAFD